MSSSSEWVQFRQQTIPGQAAAPLAGGLTDATIVTTCVTSDTMWSASNSSTAGGGQLNPKGCGVSKPIRRRSRASKKTPTTHLNANATNFRALVQQFTGCSSAPFSSGSTQKGPIHLNFGHGSNENHSNIEYSYCNQQYSHQQQQQQQQQQGQHQQLYEEQQQQQHHHHRMFSLDNINNTSDVFFSTISNHSPNIGISDNFFMENNISLHELTTMDSSFNGYGE